LAWSSSSFAIASSSIGSANFALISFQRSTDLHLVGDALLHVLQHGLRGIELRLLRQEADRVALADERLADEVLVLAGHDAQQ
jgi:hypothetical protein